MASWIDRRRNIIDRIIKTLEKTDVDDKKLALEICKEYGCTERTAKEYIMVARLKA